MEYLVTLGGPGTPVHLWWRPASAAAAMDRMRRAAAAALAVGLPAPIAAHGGADARAVIAAVPAYREPMPEAAKAGFAVIGGVLTAAGVTADFRNTVVLADRRADRWWRVDGMEAAVRSAAEAWRELAADDDRTVVILPAVVAMSVRRGDGAPAFPMRAYDHARAPGAN